MILNKTFDNTKNLYNQGIIDTKTKFTKSVRPNVKNLPIFIINLDTDTKRWNYIKSQLDFLNSNTYQRISAVDMRKPNMSELYKDDRISLYTKFTIQKKRRCDHKQIDRTGAIGATLSHHKIWRKIIDENINMAIIMEDDMHIMTNFYDILQNEIQNYNNEFDMLNLGYLKQYFSDINNSKFYFGAGCYVVTKEACEILCKYVFPIDTHVDAYFFLLNHFGYIKMIMSDKNIIFPSGNFDTTISHGILQCYPNINSNSERINNDYTVNIAIILLLFIIITIIIKIYLIKSDIKI
jgi:glycosyl transferase family 25